MVDRMEKLHHEIPPWYEPIKVNDTHSSVMDMSQKTKQMYDVLFNEVHRLLLEARENHGNFTDSLSIKHSKLIKLINAKTKTIQAQNGTIQEKLGGVEEEIKDLNVQTKNAIDAIKEAVAPLSKIPSIIVSEQKLVKHVDQYITLFVKEKEEKTKLMQEYVEERAKLLKEHEKELSDLKDVHARTLATLRDDEDIEYDHTGCQTDPIEIVDDRMRESNSRVEELQKSLNETKEEILQLKEHTSNQLQRNEKAVENIHDSIKIMNNSKTSSMKEDLQSMHEHYNSLLNSERDLSERKQHELISHIQHLSMTIEQFEASPIKHSNSMDQLNKSQLEKLAEQYQENLLNVTSDPATPEGFSSPQLTKKE
eukprot:CAMPEP_0117428048 /NCGR_PEP_ID=MMETSP0758-20121206/7838_1 /TAXON_ID=63605 /ORGANISM="Percolomonas cosmopolitus, Strain AE-1 (ATCC 50343)" /LENGTH=365 /DNA_ID=CAMNT_0005214179 /DNA_START=599 /DNA_END=1693 /DNA_ORIENTATION=+